MRGYAAVVLQEEDPYGAPSSVSVVVPRSTYSEIVDAVAVEISEASDAEEVVAIPEPPSEAALGVADLALVRDAKGGGWS